MRRSPADAPHDTRSAGTGGHALLASLLLLATRLWAALRGLLVPLGLASHTRDGREVMASDLRAMSAASKAGAATAAGVARRTAAAAKAVTTRRVRDSDDINDDLALTEGADTMVFAGERSADSRTGGAGNDGARTPAGYGFGLPGDGGNGHAKRLRSRNGHDRAVAPARSRQIPTPARLGRSGRLLVRMGLAKPVVTTRPAAPVAQPAPVLPPVSMVPDPRPRPAVLLARVGLLAAGTLGAILAFFTFASGVGAPAVSYASGVVQVELQIPQDASLPQLEERSVVYDQAGRRLAVIDREVSRRVIPLDEIPLTVQEAVITAEDRRFHEHEGYDVEGIARAFVTNVKAREIEEGGSTITQQLAKSEVGAQQTMERKFSELLYAIALEKRFSKDELLERYLNQVYFGSRAYGIAAAAEEFFDRSPDELKTHHAALLASMIRSPNSADPRDEPELALERRNTVLSGMVDEGYITPEQYQVMSQRRLGVKESTRHRKRLPHVVDAVLREFLTNPAFGKRVKQRERLFYYGGLTITTTVDSKLQRLARQTIKEYLPDTAPTGAIASIDPQTGEIRAIASGLRYNDLEYDLATQGRRQPGSAFKPFVYAEAIREGFPLEMKLQGKSPAYFEGVSGWERDCYEGTGCGVENYGGSSYGTLDMHSALRNSVNTAAAQLIQIVGPENVVALARRMGIDMVAANPDPNHPKQAQANPAIVLGGAERGITPLEMASAFSVFANEGVRVTPHLISRVEDSQGNVIFDASEVYGRVPEDRECKIPRRRAPLVAAETCRVFEPVVNGAIVDLMEEVVDAGTGTGANLYSWDVAGKTGTTSDSKDAWFVGYTPVLSTAVWMGHAEGGVPMYGVTGGSTPASIWRAFMEEALDDMDPVEFPEVDLDDLEGVIGLGDVTVPDVVGGTDTEALTTLGGLKLIPELRDEYSTVAEGTVVWQSPSAGDVVSPGETIYVGVSTGYIPEPKKKKEDKKAEEQATEGADETAEGDTGDTTTEEPPPPDEGKGNDG